jgi:Family of unknown function (DUF6152)
MRTKLSVIILVGLVLAVSRPILAHHGTAAYDTSQTVTVKAVMTEFEFINPHCQLYFDVKNDKGEMEKWQGELTAPNKLSRAGWTKDTLKPGDAVTVSGYRSKNGSQSLWIRSLIGPGGNSLPLSENQD